MSAFSDGFLREADDSLTVVTDATGALYLDGFLRSPTGALVVTTSTAGATMQDDFLRAANGALVVNSGGTGTEIAGFLRDTNLALVVASSGGTGGRVAGFSRDAALRLVVTGLAAFTPTSIAGNELWLDAGQISGVTIDGTAVSSWTDQSGLSHPATQATGANQPIFKTAILNGKPVVRFNGTSQFMSVAGVTNNTATRTIFFVAKATALATDRTVWALSATALTGGRTVDSQWFYYGNQVDAAIPFGGNATTGFACISCRINSVTSLDLFLNNGVATNLDPEDTFAGAAALSIGANVGGAVGWWPGDIAEVISYNSALSGANLDSVRTYLGAKYGLF